MFTLLFRLKIQLEQSNTKVYFFLTFYRNFEKYHIQYNILIYSIFEWIIYLLSYRNFLSISYNYGYVYLKVKHYTYLIMGTFKNDKLYYLCYMISLLMHKCKLGDYVSLLIFNNMIAWADLSELYDKVSIYYVSQHWYVITR